MLLSLPALHLQTSKHHPLFQLPHGRYRPERESVWVGGTKWAGVWLPTGSADAAFCSFVPGEACSWYIDLLWKSACLLQGKGSVFWRAGSCCEGDLKAGSRSEVIYKYFVNFPCSVYHANKSLELVLRKKSQGMLPHTFILALLCHCLITWCMPKKTISKIELASSVAGEVLAVRLEFGLYLGGSVWVLAGNVICRVSKWILWKEHGLGLAQNLSGTASVSSLPWLVYKGVYFLCARVRLVNIWQDLFH